MADKREEVNNRLQEQQDKLSQLEEKLQQLLRGSGCSDRRRSNDSGTITWSDEETNTIKVRYFGKRQISSLKVTSSREIFSSGSTRNHYIHLPFYLLHAWNSFIYHLSLLYFTRLSTWI